MLFKKHSTIIKSIYLQFVEHECAPGYTLFAKNQMCGTQEVGSAGEVNLGGPGWPSATTSNIDSEKACAKECNDRVGCTHYIWFNDNGCRTQTSCSVTIAWPWAATATSFICERGYFNFYQCVRGTLLRLIIY